MKDENDLYYPIINGAKAVGFELYRIADGTTGLKPFDIGGIAPDGRAVAMEAKYCRNRITSKLHRIGEAIIPWSVFQPQQIAWLKCFVKRGGLAIAYIYYSQSKTHALFVIMDELEIGCTIPTPYYKMYEMEIGYTKAIQIHGWDKLLSVCPRYPSPETAIEST